MHSELQFQSIEFQLVRSDIVEDIWQFLSVNIQNVLHDDLSSFFLFGGIFWPGNVNFHRIFNLALHAPYTLLKGSRGQGALHGGSAYLDEDWDESCLVKTDFF